MSLDAFAASAGSISVDWVIIGILIAVVCFDALRSGLGRTAALALAFPISSVLWEILPRTAVLGGLITDTFTAPMRFVLFALLFVAAYLALRRIIPWYGDAPGALFSAVLGTLAAVALALLFWIQTPVLDALWHFSPSIRVLFSEPYTFWWLLAALAAIAFARN